jgi:mannitol-1-/sugar-/sorbitol-6-/2-deoxyglucose-6-phosphatase
MNKGPEAVIFDMDGVLIDSEHLWRKAMITAFLEYGMPLTENDCRKTMGMRIGEVINLWLNHFKKPAQLAASLEERIIRLLLNLIDSEGKVIEGIPRLIDYCSEKQLKLGLATSSSHELMEAVLVKTGLKEIIRVAVSAEKMRYAKPHPEVFLACALELAVLPEKCLVIEDSLNGVIAAKAARMTVVAVPDDEHLKTDLLRAKQFVLADHRAGNMHEVLALFKNIFG